MPSSEAWRQELKALHAGRAALDRAITEEEQGEADIEDELRCLTHRLEEAKPDEDFRAQCLADVKAAALDGSLQAALQAVRASREAAAKAPESDAGGNGNSMVAVPDMDALRAKAAGLLRNAGGADGLP